MRIHILILGIVALATGAIISGGPAHAELICENYWVQTSQGLQCRRRCWDTAPRYQSPPDVPALEYDPEPDPEYEITHNNTYSATADGGSSESGEFAMLAMLILAGLLIAGISSSTSATAPVEAEIEATMQGAASARELTGGAAAKNAEIDSFIETTSRAHYERGRAAADEEWTRG